jgi:hypothetical protein
MRTLFSVALCFVLGACATKPDIYGEYDWAIFLGQNIPGDFFTDGWMELTPEGTWTAVATRADGSGQMTFEGGFSAGDEVDGCVLFEAWFSSALKEPFTDVVAVNEPFPGKICDGEFATDCGKGLAYKRQ